MRDTIATTPTSRLRACILFVLPRQRTGTKALRKVRQEWSPG